jgi:hypothetical protein
MNQLSEQRLGEILDALGSVEAASGEDGEEIRALVAEVRERRKQAPHSREQRFGFMIRLVKDAMPEVARELREIYDEQNNAIYYARRDADYWKSECDKLKEDL